MTAETEALWPDQQVISLSELVEVSGLTRDELLELVHGGAIPAREAQGGSYLFGAHVIRVARTACRLRDELELDMTALNVALRLLDRVHALEDEIARMRALLPRGQGDASYQP